MRRETAAESSVCPTQTLHSMPGCQQQQNIYTRKTRTAVRIGGPVEQNTNMNTCSTLRRNSLENSPYQPSSSNSGGCASVGLSPRSRGPRAAGPAATRGRSGYTRSRTRWCPRTCRGARRRGPSAPPAPCHSCCCCCLLRMSPPPLLQETETAAQAGS